MELTRRQFTTGFLAAAMTTGLTGCVTTNQATGRRSFTGFYDIEDDIRMGKEAAPRLMEQFGGAYNSKPIASYVSKVGFQLAATTEMKDLPYRFTVLNSPIVNAFALPGGFVFISRGLLALAGNEAEIASVLAHELGHVNARHSAERMTQGMVAGIGAAVLGVLAGSRAVSQIANYGAQVWVKGFSRQQEFEADMLGVRYMSRAGYEPEAAVTFLSTLRKHSMLEAKLLGLPPGRVDEFNIMSTHPRTIERVRVAMKAAKATRPVAPRTGRKDYLARINGLLYGDDPKQGIVYGRRFVHQPLRFEFTVPDSFRINNGRKAVIAKHPKGSIIVFDMGEIRSSGNLTGYVQREWAAKTRLSNLESLSINGLKGATGTTRGRIGKHNASIRLLALQGDGKKVFRFMFAVPVGQARPMSEKLRRTAYSFRRLSTAEAAKIHPMRLQVAPASARDTVQALAKTLPYGKYKEEAFRILNGLRPGEQITAGRSVKVIAL